MKRYLTLDQKRAALKLAYKEQHWVDKVDKMSSMQVYAIFDQFCMNGTIYFDDYKNIHFRSKEEVQELKEKRLGIHQITLDEWIKSKDICDE